MGKSSTRKAAIGPGDAFPRWRGSLFVRGLTDHTLVRLLLEKDRVTGESTCWASAASVYVTYGRDRTARCTSSRTRRTASSGESPRAAEDKTASHPLPASRSLVAHSVRVDCLLSLKRPRDIAAVKTPNEYGARIRSKVPIQGSLVLG